MLVVVKRACCCSKVITVRAQDNPDAFAVMEKTRLFIFHGDEPEVVNIFSRFLFFEHKYLTSTFKLQQFC